MESLFSVLLLFWGVLFHYLGNFGQFTYFSTFSPFSSHFFGFDARVFHLTTNFWMIFTTFCSVIFGKYFYCVLDAAGFTKFVVVLNASIHLLHGMSVLTDFQPKWVSFRDLFSQKKLPILTNQHSVRFESLFHNCWNNFSDFFHNKVSFEWVKKLSHF